MTKPLRFSKKTFRVVPISKRLATASINWPLQQSGKVNPYSKKAPADHVASAPKFRSSDISDEDKALEYTRLPSNVVVF